MHLKLLAIQTDLPTTFSEDRRVFDFEQASQPFRSFGASERAMATVNLNGVRAPDASVVSIGSLDSGLELTPVQPRACSFMRERCTVSRIAAWRCSPRRRADLRTDGGLRQKAVRDSRMFQKRPSCGCSEIPPRQYGMSFSFMMTSHQLARSDFHSVAIAKLDSRRGNAKAAAKENCRTPEAPRWPEPPSTVAVHESYSIVLS